MIFSENLVRKRVKKGDNFPSSKSSHPWQSMKKGSGCTDCVHPIPYRLKLINSTLFVEKSGNKGIAAEGRENFGVFFRIFWSQKI